MSTRTLSQRDLATLSFKDENSSSSSSSSTLNASLSNSATNQNSSSFQPTDLKSSRKSLSLNRKEVNYDAEINENSTFAVLSRIRTISKTTCNIIEKPDKDILKRKARKLLALLPNFNELDKLYPNRLPNAEEYCGGPNNHNLCDIFKRRFNQFADSSKNSIIQLYVDSLQEDIELIESEIKTIEDNFYTEVNNVIAPLIESMDDKTYADIENNVNEILKESFHDPREQHMITNKEKIALKVKKYDIKSIHMKSLENEKAIDNFIENFDYYTIVNERNRVMKIPVFSPLKL